MPAAVRRRPPAPAAVDPFACGCVLPEWQQGLAASMTESQLEGHVHRAARALGYELAYHTKISVRSTPGFPDDVFLRQRDARGVIFEEKTMRGKVTDAQLAWLEGWARVGLVVAVVRPCCYLTDRVLNLLQGGPDA